MREDISQSCLLLAEMTNYNKGAYWEAGYAEGLKIPVIYLCERSVFESTDKAMKTAF
jgi:nucleoside 2-deoxyribosyltransferase